MLHVNASIDNSNLASADYVGPDAHAAGCDSGLPDESSPAYRTFFGHLPEGPFETPEEQMEYEAWLSEVAAERELERDRAEELQCQFDQMLRERQPTALDAVHAA